MVLIAAQMTYTCVNRRGATEKVPSINQLWLLDSYWRSCWLENSITLSWLSGLLSCMRNKHELFPPVLFHSSVSIRSFNKSGSFEIAPCLVHQMECLLESGLPMFVRTAADDSSRTYDRIWWGLPKDDTAMSFILETAFATVTAVSSAGWLRSLEDWISVASLSVVMAPLHKRERD